MTIQRLIVLSAPSGIGKSHLIRQMQKGGELAERIGIEPDTPVMEAGALASIQAPTFERLILHYISSESAILVR